MQPTASSPVTRHSSLEYCGRFAPSPTGPLHFGSLVAAVGSYLEARVHGGRWLVRVEDLDRPRVVDGSADEILKTLEACGMEWDGRIVHQSTRSEAYHCALHALRQHGRVYACACSRREIADSGVTGIEGYVYPRTCRAGLQPGRVARAWRIDTGDTVVAFGDAIQGRIEQDVGREVGDFVLYRADRVYAYQLAVAVDDAEQGVTHVVRGADLLESTPRQIFLQRLLDLPTPRYAHLPVAVNGRGEKLSKQTRAQPVDPNRAGHAIARALRFLGHDVPEELERARVPVLWEWATANWQLERVPRLRTRSAITMNSGSSAE
jgi:glutamyl-Q tRNA(Asp) synthetase